MSSENATTPGDGGWTDCPRCMLRQRENDKGRCRRCGAALRLTAPGESGLINMADVAASTPAADREAVEDAASLGDILAEPASVLDEYDDDGVASLDLLDEGGEDATFAAPDSGPSRRPRPPRRDTEPLPDGGGSALRDAADSVAAGVGEAASGLTQHAHVFVGRLRDRDPGALRLLALFGLLVVITAAGILFEALRPGEAIDGRRVSSGLGLDVRLPDDGWYRERLDLGDGAGETFRSARSADEAATLLWIRILPTPADAGGRMDLASLTASGAWLEEQAFSVLPGVPVFEERSGCGPERIGTKECVRCRSQGRYEDGEFEFDVFGLEHGGDVLLVLLANRQPVTSASFATAFDIIESLVAPPEAKPAVDATPAEDA